MNIDATSYPLFQGMKEDMEQLKQLFIEGVMNLVLVKISEAKAEQKKRAKGNSTVMHMGMVRSTFSYM
jgi:hypothetical protein